MSQLLKEQKMSVHLQSSFPKRSESCHVAWDSTYTGSEDGNSFMVQAEDKEQVLESTKTEGAETSIDKIAENELKTHGLRNRSLREGQRKES